MSSAAFPNCCRQVLHILNKFFESSSPESLQTPALFVSAFISELIDNYLFHNTTPRLSSLQELHLLEVLCKYFEGQKREFVGWCVFDLLFSFSDQEQRESKVNKQYSCKSGRHTVRFLMHIEANSNQLLKIVVCQPCYCIRYKFQSTFENRCVPATALDILDNTQEDF